MTRLLRSKSYTFGRVSTSNSSVLDVSPRSSSLYNYNDDDDDDDNEEYSSCNCPATETPFLSPDRRHRNRVHNHSPILAVVVAALRKSLVTCSVDRDDVANVDISWPTDVSHVSHVTFDRFNGFLGLPTELQPEVPRKVPSASASVFGVSVQSMQCSYDHRGNSVPTILLMLQSRLYTEGGLQAEGIFRINAENSQEETVRNQLNRGIVPFGIDVHCLAGLIKAWFRELPTGVLDSLSPEQVMRCNTEAEYSQLVNLIPTTEAALLDWAVNLMADVVHNEHYNKMNARNIAMVFAPNMTQVVDPLTALMHAVQVMNFLKTLIMKTIREREESHVTCQMQSSCPNNPSCMLDYLPTHSNGTVLTKESVMDGYSRENRTAGKLSRSATSDRTDCMCGENLWNCNSTSNAGGECDTVVNTSPVARRRQTLESRFREGFDTEEAESTMVRLGLRKGMQKLYRHPVFQLSKPVKKSRLIGIVNSRRGGGEALA